MGTATKQTLFFSKTRKDVVVNTYEMYLKDKRQKLVKTLSKIKDKKQLLKD